MPPHGVPDAPEEARGLRRPRRVGRREGRVREARPDAVAHVELERLEPLVPEAQHGGAQRAGGALVVEPHVGGGPAGVVVGLGRHPGAGVVLGHPPELDEAAEPGLLARPHDDDEVVLRAHRLLDEQGHVVHDDGVRAGGRDALGGAGPDRRVGDRLEVAQGGGVAEDEAAEGGTVEGAVGGQDLGAEAVDDGGEAGGAGLDDLARHRVGVDDDRAEGGQLGRHGRLARPDPAGEAHAQHAPTLVGGPVVLAHVRPQVGQRGIEGARCRTARRARGW